eukprot:364502-Chlamydomonas_euryale.AAC.16
MKHEAVVAQAACDHALNHEAVAAHRLCGITHLTCEVRDEGKGKCAVSWSSKRLVSMTKHDAVAVRAVRDHGCTHDYGGGWHACMPSPVPG